MIVKVGEHEITIIKTPVNEKEVNVTKVQFEFDEDMQDMVKEAYFTYKNNSYKVIIQNNECDIPNEVLTEKGQVELGVVCFEVQNDELLKRYNPSPAYFDSWSGSLREAENTEPITPTDKEQIESAIAQLENDVEELDNTKQDTLVSGENIKTINNESLLGSGNLEVITDLSDYYTKEEIDNKGYINKDVDDLTNYTKTSDLSEVALSGSYNDLEDTPNLSVYSLITETGSKIDLEINSTTYVLTAKLYDKNNNLLSTSTGIDLPLETMVVGASYDSETKEIILTLKNGQEVRFSVADLVSGLQTEITPTNKLASDLVDDTNQTHKFVSQSEKTQIATNTTNIAGIKNGTTINSFSGVESALNGKEDKSNKVTSISSSSTDTQYPSAKCMYDSQALQDNEISDLKSENDYLNSIINQLPKVSSQGTILTLNNTIAGKMNIELGTSELEQETTTGKNILNNTTFVKGRLDNGVVGYASGTTSVEATATGIKVITNEQYRGATSDFIEVDSSTIYVVSNNPSKTQYVAQYDTNKDFISQNSGNASPYIFTTNASTKYIRVGYIFGVAGTYEVENAMLEKGSSATSFEKFTYGASPNPNYEQPIHTISGDNTIKVENGNLLDLSTLVQGYYITGANPTITGTTDGRFRSFSKYLNAGTYTINFNKNANATRAFTDYDYSSDNALSNFYNAKTGTFTMTQDGTAYFSFRKNDSTNWNDNEDLVWLNKGTTGTDYVEHQEQTAQLNLGDIEYCEIGDYKDEFVRDNEGNWGIRKNIGKVVLDGSEDVWTSSTSGIYTRFNISISDILNQEGRNTDVISNYFTASDTDNYGIFFHFRSALLFYPTSDITTEILWKSWLNTHNTSVYYPLATPTYTPITGTLAEQLENIYQYLLSYKGQTSISQINNDLPFNISASALLDLNSLIGG